MNTSTSFLFIFSLLYLAAPTQARAFDPLLAIVIMVKNEGHIERQEPVIVETLKPFALAGVDSFFVLDTGSTDNTVEVTQKFFDDHNIKHGHIAQEPFVDFSTSRNRALQLAKQAFPDACFFIMPDAEWYIHNAEGLLQFCAQEAYKFYPETYSLRTVLGATEYQQRRLLRKDSSAHFTGVVHETIEFRSTSQVPQDIWFEFRRSPKGTQASADRWHRDEKLLTEEYFKDPHNPRTIYYLAQTYECLGKLAHANLFFKTRANMNDWDLEERFEAQYARAEITSQKHNQEADPHWTKPLKQYLRAFAIRPHRAEPLIKIAQHYLWLGQHAVGFIFAQRACQIPYPSQDRLFVKKPMYDYTRWDVLGQCAWYVGEFELGEDAVKKALEAEPYKEHLHENLSVYQERRARLAGAA